jgi:hypothetical protein
LRWNIYRLFSQHFFAWRPPVVWIWTRALVYERLESGKLFFTEVLYLLTVTFYFELMKRYVFQNREKCQWHRPIKNNAYVVKVGVGVLQKKNVVVVVIIIIRLLTCLTRPVTAKH